MQADKNFRNRETSLHIEEVEAMPDSPKDKVTIVSPGNDSLIQVPLCFSMFAWSLVVLGVAGLIMVTLLLSIVYCLL